LDLYQNRTQHCTSSSLAGDTFAMTLIEVHTGISQYMQVFWLLARIVHLEMLTA
jgi:hypothetical protein